MTADAEKKVIPTGTDLVTFSVANNIGYGDHAKVNYFTVNMWGKSGIGVFPYLLKGKAIAISGTLEVQSWTGQDGVKHSKNVINTNALTLLADSKPAPTSQYSSTKDDDNPYDYPTGDVPF